jgi:hypothetical protein
MKHLSRIASHRPHGLALTALGALWVGAACSSGGSGAAGEEPAAPIAPVNGSPEGPAGGSTNGTTTSPGGGESNPAQGAALDPNAAGAADSEWCDALAVLRQNCQSCHAEQPQFGAPMSLVSFADLEAPSVSDAMQSVRERVSARIHDAQRPMPPGGMSAANVAILDAWLDAGGGAGADPTCAGLAPAPVPTESADFVWPEDCEEFFTLTTSSRTNPAEKYVVPAGSEEHPQFIFDAPWGNDDVQVLAHRPITDNSRILHHWILYENSTGGLFGGGLGGKFLVGWAPGSQGNTGMPDDVGMYMPGGADTLRLDVHYYNLGSTQAESDASGVELCITRTPRPFTATVSGLTGNANARVGRSDNATSCTVNLTGTDQVTFLSVSPHMHKLGVHAKLELTRDGQTTALHDGPFDFEDQRIYELDNVAIRDGDVLTTTCSYENDTGRSVGFGENSDDEMCFNFVTYYPMGAFQCGFSL